MINPDFHMTLYISEEFARQVCLCIGFVVGSCCVTWGVVKMTEILFGKKPEVKQDDQL
jgi:hypothetical protein